MTRLWTARLAWPVRSLGPGPRAVLWVAGCKRRCRGCIAPELFDRNSGRPVPVERLADRLVSLPSGPGGLQGLTISGGEPFEQAGALVDLLRRIRTGRAEWNIMAYSGHTVMEIRRTVPDGPALLSELDALIDGPYVATLSGNARWCGSSNQRLHVLTERGRVWLESSVYFPPAADVGLGSGGSSWILGVPAVERRESVRRVLAGHATLARSATGKEGLR